MTVVSCRPWHRFLTLFAVAFFSIGCDDVLGPEKMPVAIVDGKVSQRGKPVTRGWIEFIPVDGAVGRMRSARLHSDGTFHATKVPVGVILIRLVNIDWEPIQMRRFFGVFSSPIRRSVSQNNNLPLEIDLADEYLKMTRSPPKEKSDEHPGERGER
jgi:hypothetical protein